MGEEVFKDVLTPTVNQIIRYVEEEEDDSQIPQPIFLVGSHGTGKTYVIECLFAYLEQNGIVVSVQKFDGKRFFSSSDIIKAIGEDCYGGQEDITHVAEVGEVYGQKRRVVIIDDMDYYFNRSSFDDQYVLRNYLYKETAPLLIGSISEIGNFLADYRAPFFEGIRVLYMPTFDYKKVDSMGLTEDIRERLMALMRLLPPVIGSFKIASDIVAVSNSKDKDLEQLLNRFSSSYSEILEGLPVNSQKILYYLAASKDNLTLSSLRDLTGIPAGILSTYLRQLIKTKIVQKATSVKRGVPYEIRDPLFKLWLQ